jgi:hypothetical protein
MIDIIFITGIRLFIFVDWANFEEDGLVFVE